MSRRGRGVCYRRAAGALRLLAVIGLGSCATAPRPTDVCPTADPGIGGARPYSRYDEDYRIMAVTRDPRLPRRINCDLPPPGMFMALVVGEVIWYGTSARAERAEVLLARIRVDTTLVGSSFDTLEVTSGGGLACADSNLVDVFWSHGSNPGVLPAGRVALSAFRPLDNRRPSRRVGVPSRNVVEPQPLFIDRVYYLDAGGLEPGKRLCTGIPRFLVPREEVCLDGEIRPEELHAELTETTMTLDELVSTFANYYR